MSSNKKDTNPKDGIGIRKWRQYCSVPVTVIWEIGIAMLEGALKYGRHNYRKAGVRSSVYTDAAKGHIDQYIEGEDIDPESGVHHLSKAIASLVVLRDGQIRKFWVDDRPPKSDINRIREELQKQVDEIFDRIDNPLTPYLEIDKGESGGKPVTKKGSKHVTKKGSKHESRNR